MAVAHTQFYFCGPWVSEGYVSWVTESATPKWVEEITRGRRRTVALSATGKKLATQHGLHTHEIGLINVVLDEIEDPSAYSTPPAFDDDDAGPTKEKLRGIWMDTTTTDGDERGRQP